MKVELKDSGAEALDDMDKELFICYKCLAVQTKDEMRPSSKIKKLSVEASRKFKMCKGCKGRVFLR